jgi:predicted nucleic acid-binding protein
MVGATLDVNVLVSATIMRRGIPYQLLDAWHAQRFDMVTSEHIIVQAAVKLRSDKFSATA